MRLGKGRCVSIPFIGLLGVVGAGWIASLILSEAVQTAGCPMLRASLIALANATTTLGLSLFIALAAPYIDVCSDMLLSLAPPEKRRRLEERDKRLREALRRRPGLLAAPLTALVMLSTLLSMGFRGPEVYLSLLLSPHPYLETLGLYLALRGAVQYYMGRSSRRGFAAILALSILILAAGGLAEAYVSPMIQRLVE